MFSFAQPSFAQIDRDEEVAYYGPYLHWDGSAGLVLVLRGRFFEGELNSVRRRLAIERAVQPALLRYIGKKPADLDAAGRSRMFDRLMPFLADGESNETLRMRVAGKAGSGVITLPETDSGGHFAFGTSTAGDAKLVDLVGDGSHVQVEAILPASDDRQFSVRLRVPPRDLKLLVISDVDDTVRIAEVLDRPRMIERVFLRPYESVPGMSNLYRELAARGAEFHFVSGSPWQVAGLIELLLAEDRFPPAVLHCRQLSWDFWNSDPLHTKEFKVATINLLLKQFPTCKVLMIGDDGEHDPEVYTEIGRAHPERVAGVWIRRVNPRPVAERLAELRVLLGKDRVVDFGDSAEVSVAASLRF
jgi:hypothetical protein